MPITDKIFTAAIDSGTWKAARNGKTISSADLSVNPQSVNLSLHPQLLEVFPSERLGFIDLHDPTSFYAVHLDCRDGAILHPGRLYLGAVQESFDCSAPLWIRNPQARLLGKDGGYYSIHTDKYEELRYFYPVVDGRSTCARVGLSVHQTCGRGDFGFSSAFTLEITVVLPVKIYAGDELAQIFFERVDGGEPSRYDGAYTNQNDGPRVAALGAHRFQRGAK